MCRAAYHIYLNQNAAYHHVLFQLLDHCILSGSEKTPRGQAHDVHKYISARMQLVLVSHAICVPGGIIRRRFLVDRECVGRNVAQHTLGQRHVSGTNYEEVVNVMVQSLADTRSPNRRGHFVDLDEVEEKAIYRNTHSPIIHQGPRNSFHIH